MSHQKMSSGAKADSTAEAPEFNGSENIRAGAVEAGPEIPDNEWTSRFDESSAGKAGQEADAKPGAGENREIPLPKVDFSTFLLSLASSALVQLGEVPNPETGQNEENLLLAKHTIDIISMLREKTRNCLDAGETKLIEGILYELRLKYVIKAK